MSDHRWREIVLLWLWLIWFGVCEILADGITEDGSELWIDIKSFYIDIEAGKDISVIVSEGSGFPIADHFDEIDEGHIVDAI